MKNLEITIISSVDYLNLAPSYRRNNKVIVIGDGKETNPKMYAGIHVINKSGGYFGVSVNIDDSQICISHKDECLILDTGKTYALVVKVNLEDSLSGSLVSHMVGESSLTLSKESVEESSDDDTEEELEVAQEPNLAQEMDNDEDTKDIELDRQEYQPISSQIVSMPELIEITPFKPEPSDTEE